MAKIIYSKLVRDKIPEIIEKAGKTCEIRVMDNEEYKVSLDQKMQEELKEYLESDEVEELADLETVLRAILKYKGVSKEEFESIVQSKIDKRGDFDKKLFLVSVEEK